jgi:hypothetical protein
VTGLAQVTGCDWFFSKLSQTRAYMGELPEKPVTTRHGLKPVTRCKRRGSSLAKKDARVGRSRGFAWVWLRNPVASGRNEEHTR